MKLKCTICDTQAEFAVKGTNTGYCKEHALEFFGDIGLLAPAQELANAMNQAVESQVEENCEDK
ncbi:MAG: hypothetical protein ACI8Y7_000811 [Candidatus Woesearchaeota archaeon]|jgi:hypothetical protein